jgi:hypothetical protein
MDQPTMGQPDTGQPIYGRAVSCVLMLEDVGLAPRDTRAESLDSMHYRAPQVAGHGIPSMHEVAHNQDCQAVTHQVGDHCNDPPPCPLKTKSIES